MKLSNFYVFIFLLISLLFINNLKAESTDIEAANNLAKLGIIVDKSNNTSEYRLDSTITRREMLKIMMKLSGKDVKNKCDEKFKDLKKNDWGCKYAETALKYGYIAPNEYFRPDDLVSKVEALKMIFKAKGLEREKTNDWREGYVNTATKLGIINKSFNDYDNKSNRGWIFSGADNIITKKINNSSTSTYIPKICTMEYTPVCGIDGKTYSNKCMAGDTDILHNGECNNDINKNNNQIEIVFAGDMNKLSVENNLKIYPEAKKELIWKDEKTLNIKINEDIDNDTDFIVNIDKETLTKQGTKINKTIIKKFKVTADTKIDFISPEGNITDLTKNITVRFNKPITSLTTFDNQKSCPIKIIPDLKGKCVWITTSTFQFRPDQGFPIGAEYNVEILSGVKAIDGSFLKEGKKITIVTPKFRLINKPSYNINKDEKLYFYFNSDIDLNLFKNNFVISGYNNDKLDIKYYEDNISDSIKEVKKNIITVFPKIGDWGYSQNYTYAIKRNIKSIRGNIPLGKDITISIKTNNLLSNYSSFVYKNIDIENKELTSNIRKASNKNIITINNPNIIFNFYEEIKLDKSLFNIDSISTNDFNIKYAKVSKYIDGENIIEENKKSIILEINKENINKLKIEIRTNKISQNSENLKLIFRTKENNKIEKFKFIKNKKSCLVTKNQINTYGENKNIFDFGDDSEVNSIYEVNKYNSYEEDCPYITGKNTYVINTRLTPEKDYNLTIKKDLLDLDNYPLDKEYNFNFTTGKAQNEDKYLNLVDSRDIILVPTDITPLGVAIKTVNLDKINIEICEGDLNIENTDFIENKNCKNKDIRINNLGFKTNFSVINLEEIFESNFNKSIVTLKISKLEEDKTEYELEKEEKSYYREKITHFIRTNKTIVFKGNGKNNLLWLTDYKTGELLDDEIIKIERFSKENNYSKYGKYLGLIAKFFSNLDFKSIGNGLYEVEGKPSGYLLITLKSGEKIFLNTNYLNFSYPTEKIYITTDRPLYKPGNTVNIKGTIRKQTAKGYEVSNKDVYIKIRDSRYKILIDEKISSNNNGTFNYTYKLEENSNLGQYSIETYLDDSRYGAKSKLNFSVEEYEKPDFKITTNSQQDTYYYGEEPKINIKADYYVGVPLSNGEGTYSIKASDYIFNGGKTKGYIWGKNNNFYWWGIKNNRNSSNNIVYNTKYKLNNKGTAEINIDTSKTIKNKIYNFSTTITDPNTKKSISSNTSFKILRNKVFSGMKFDKYYYDYGDNAKIDFITVDSEGNKIGNTDIVFKVYKINYKYDKNTYNSTKEEQKITETKLTTSNNGEANIDFDFNDSGEYRFEIELENGKYKTTKTFYISGYNLVKPKENNHKINILKNKEKYNILDNAEFIIQSDNVGVKALITVEKLDQILFKKVIDINSNSQKFILPIKKEYLPNFELHVFIIKPVENYNDSIEKLKALRIEMKELEQKIYSNEENIRVPQYICYDIVNKGGIIPRNNYSGVDEIYLDLLSKDRTLEQNIMQNIIPGYFSGKINVKINLDSIKINSNVILDKESYLPGDTQTITLELNDNNGNPINGEAVISIVDESLLALKNNDRNIVDFFYGEVKNFILTKFNLNKLIKRFEFTDEDFNNRQPIQKSFSRGINFGGEKISPMLKGASLDYSEGEMMMDSVVMEESISTSGANNNSTKIRTDFKDSAFYKGTVNITNGKTTITVPKLPDNLTTWVIKGYTVTTDTKVGNFEKKFKVQKELNLLPSIPRFFVVGDETEISGIIINNSNNELETNITLSSDNLESDLNTQTIVIPAKSQSPFVFKVKVKNKDNNITWEEYKANIRLTAKSGDLIDSLKLTKNIIAYSTPEYTFTNGSTYDVSFEEKINIPDYVDKDFGYLDISIGGTILTNLLDNIDKLASNPFYNSYSIISTLNKAAALKGLYNSAGELNKFNNIEITNFLGEKIKLNDLIKEQISNIKNYQNSDGGIMYYDDCINTYRRSCSNFNLTGDFLKTAKNLKENGFYIDENIIKQALSYYKKELIEIINHYEKNGSKYNNINPFYTILGYENDFISEYIFSDRFSNTDNFNNISKLKLILILQTIAPQDKSIQTLINQIKNSIIIEARGSLIPSNKWSKNNVLSTALGLKAFINNKENEKLIIENFARFLISQKRENGDFDNSFNSSEVIQAITNYIIYTKELENINFTAKAYLNNNEIISSTFNKENKFDIVSKSFSLKDYLNFGIDNSLGFEKTGSGKLYYDIGLRYYLPIEKIDSRDEGIIVKRSYYNYDEYKQAFKKECYYPFWRGLGAYYRSFYPCETKKVKPIKEVSSGKKGDYIIGEIELIVPHERNNVIVNNYIPSGAEIVNINFNTTSNEIKNITKQDNTSWWSGYDHIENKTDKMILYANKLYKGSYKYTYVLKLNHKGLYHHRPAIAEEMKKPEIWGRSKGEYFEIK